MHSSAYLSFLCIGLQLTCICSHIFIRLVAFVLVQFTVHSIHLHLLQDLLWDYRHFRHICTGNTFLRFKPTQVLALVPVFVTQAAQNKGQHLYLHLGLGYLKEIMQKTLQPFAEDVDNNKWAFKLEAWSWAKLIRVELNMPALSTSSKPDPEPSLNLPSAYSNKALDECWVGIIWGRPNPSSSDPFKAPWICSCTDEWFPNASRWGKAKEGRQ